MILVIIFIYNHLIYFYRFCVLLFLTYHIYLIRELKTRELKIETLRYTIYFVIR